MIGARIVVIGVGNEFRRDDGVGPVVAARVAELAAPEVRVSRCDGEPTALLDMWSGTDAAVLIDAVVCAPSSPGRVWRTQAGGLPGRGHTGNSHAIGIAEAVSLGRVLGRLPRDLVVVAVEAERLDYGVGLSEPVSRAIPEAIDTVLAELVRLGRPSTR
ncbi:hydrogenase maturation protease [Nocardia bovistercoris]|uniref:Hydrogenase maturation protease n=1 Tax=Nocardia bovistercoris TaxID=2785916 RepID=A0A931N7L3_9NOCA|nr:hydrogenase maturation protease [Nocardia bovistercoris]MBH0781746.1 hydrogenase maturation protease [Nocardia bovistercoris]